MTATVLAVGLGDFAKYVDELPDLMVEAARMAVNDTSRDTVPMIKRRMRKEVNFPSGYLNKERLSVRRKATRVRLEAVIAGRDRPTSLARFAPGAKPHVRGSVKRPIFVKVKAGDARKMDRAFIVELRNGNLGLAIRLPKGETPREAYKPVALTRGGGRPTGAWLLYGPSVDQVMKGVADETQDDVLDMLNRNFARHLSRLTRG